VHEKDTAGVSTVHGYLLLVGSRVVFPYVLGPDRAIT
jgi:hypothetical protein